MSQKDLSTVGTPAIRKDARDKATGKLEYTYDLNHKFTGLLYARIVRSTEPHAKIISIDTSEAVKLYGVRKVLTASDFPPNLSGFGFLDEPLFAHDKVCYHGEPIAAVIADDPFIAEAARELVAVEYEPLPHVLDPEEAAMPNPKVVIHNSNEFVDLAPFAGMKRYEDRPNVYNHKTLRVGDAERGFAEADYIIENVYSTQLASHCALEPHSAIAQKHGDGSIEIWCGSQAVFANKTIIAYFMGLSSSMVRQHSPCIGGSFGNRNSPKANLMAACLASKVDRPVRVDYDRSESFNGTVLRHPFKIYAKDGITKSGKWVATEMTAYNSGGAYSDMGWIVTRNTVYAFGGQYDIPNIKFDAFGVYTNHTPAAAFRGFGAAQIQWALEQQVDIMAKKLEMDPFEFRKNNMIHEGGANALGEVVHSYGAPECLEKVVKAIRSGGGSAEERSSGSRWSRIFGGGKKSAAKANQEDSKGDDGSIWVRGKGFALGSKYTFAPSWSTATIKVLPDGFFDLRMSADEMGQGIQTGIAQLAAEELKVPVEKIRMVPLDTDISPYDMGSYSSRSLFATGNAVVAACKDAKRQIFEIAGPKMEVEPDELDMENGEVFVKTNPDKKIPISDVFEVCLLDGTMFPSSGEILGKTFFFYPCSFNDPDTGVCLDRGHKMSAYYMYSAQAAEVAVNLETGQVKVEKLYIATDCGKAINPELVITQQHDAAQMGIGLALYEELHLKNGKMANPNFTDYKFPTACEAPSLGETKVFLVEAKCEDGPWGAKGTGEVVVVSTPPAIANAIYDAIGVRIGDAPITQEKIWCALHANN